MVGGREGIRTPDPLLAKQVLSQLSYTPDTVWIKFRVFSESVHLHFWQAHPAFRPLRERGIVHRIAISRQLFRVPFATSSNQLTCANVIPSALGLYTARA